MDLLLFGVIALALATVGLLVSLIIGVREAVSRSQERRYVARTARFTGRRRVAG